MAIAVFDSGIGGLSVLSQARRRLPKKDYVYYADTKNVPYGVKSKEEVLGYVNEAAEFLLGLGNIEALVLACNTATSVAAASLRSKYDIPILGMEPAVKPAVTADKVHRILVTATPLTLKEEKMQALLAKWDNEHLSDLLPLPKLVEFAEKGDFQSPAVEEYLQDELSNFALANYSAIVLGCTHFNFFRHTLRRLLPANVHIIDGSQGTVRHLASLVDESEEKGKVSFYNSKVLVSEAEELARYQKLLAILEDNMRIE